MNILIAGASGFIGRQLTEELSKTHHITVLGRDIKRLQQYFSEKINKVTWAELTNHDAKQYDLIINLSGSNIGAKRWSSTVKNELIASRTLSNQNLIHWLLSQQASPRYFCANAVGIYGAQEISSTVYDEFSPIEAERPDDFLRKIALDWEQSLNPAVEQGLSVTTLRFGVVLKKGEGMLKKLEFPFRLGLGSILSHGQQVISWVHYKDLVHAITFLIANPSVSGPMNITAPYPVSQREFACAFAKILKRPLLIKMPSSLIKLLFGEMGEDLLLKGQKVVPKRLQELGFQFSYPELSQALKEEYQPQ